MSNHHPDNDREKSPWSLRRRLLLGGLVGGPLLAAGQISDAWWSSLWKAFFKLAPSPTLYTYSGHPSRMSSVAWSPDGTRIASGGRDRFVRVWRVF
jgi:WD40 repeat protein